MNLGSVTEQVVRNKDLLQHMLESNIVAVSGPSMTSFNAPKFTTPSKVN